MLRLPLPPNRSSAIPTATALAVTLASLCAATAAAGQSCRIGFAVAVTQGVGTIPPGTVLHGDAVFALSGRSFRQDGGSTAHLAEGQMTVHLDDPATTAARPTQGRAVTGAIWALATTSRGAVADMVGVYARDVAGLSFGGVDYAGPMMITLYGPPDSLPGIAPPTDHAGWDAMNLRRSFAVHAQGYDRLAGDVTTLEVTCTTGAPASVDNHARQAYPAPQ